MAVPLWFSVNGWNLMKEVMTIARASPPVSPAYKNQEGPCPGRVSEKLFNLAFSKPVRAQVSSASLFPCTSLHVGGSPVTLLHRS